EPARQRYLDGNHALVGGVLLDDAPLVDDAEALTYAFAACANVGCDGRAAQPLEGFVQPLIAAAAGLPAGRDEEVIHREPHGTIPGILSAPVQPLHELADHVNENILVVLGGAAQHRGRNFDVLAAALSAPLPDAQVGLGRKRGARRFHACAV